MLLTIAMQLEAEISCGHWTHYGTYGFLMEKHYGIQRISMETPNIPEVRVIPVLLAGEDANHYKAKGFEVHRYTPLSNSQLFWVLL